MSAVELFFVAVGLSMDALAISICKGLASSRSGLKGAATAGMWFGGAQALMPVIGWFLGARFSSYIQNIDHWIAFVLLGFIGGKMVLDARHGECVLGGLTPAEMFPLAIATSIDAMAVGVTFAFLQVPIVPAACMIGITTFVLAAIGYLAGNIVGERGSNSAQMVGGVILVTLGCKILLEHLGILG